MAVLMLDQKVESPEEVNLRSRKVKPRPKAAKKCPLSVSWAFSTASFCVPKSPWLRWPETRGKCLRRNSDDAEWFVTIGATTADQSCIPTNHTPQKI